MKSLVRRGGQNWDRSDRKLNAKFLIPEDGFCTDAHRAIHAIKLLVYKPTQYVMKIYRKCCCRYVSAHMYMHYIYYVLVARIHVDVLSEHQYIVNARNAESPMNR